MLRALTHTRQLAANAGPRPAALLRQQQLPRVRQQAMGGVEAASAGVTSGHTSESTSAMMLMPRGIPTSIRIPAAGPIK